MRVYDLYPPSSYEIWKGSQPDPDEENTRVKQ